MYRIVVLSIIAIVAAMAPAYANNQPNILFIMSDDHACNAVSAYGGRLAEVAPTPNIDRIARDGMRLNKCFVTKRHCQDQEGYKESVSESIG